MKNSSFKPVIILFFLVSVSITSCLENTSVTEPTKSANDFLYVTTFLETQRYAISGPKPAAIGVDEVYNNLGNYLLIDIRDEADFSRGHIPSSVNILPENLEEYFQTNDMTEYDRIIIISQTGQRAAYVSTLLRLSGMYKVFSLDYGLGYWNSQFSTSWIDSKSSSPNVQFYRNNFPPSKSYSLSEAPTEVFEDDDLTVEEKIDFRVNSLLVSNTSDFQVSLDEFEANYDKKRRSYQNCNIIFYGDPAIFNFVYSYRVIIRDIGYYENTFALNQVFTLRPEGTLPYNSDNIGIENDLLSIPTNKIIYLYSINGQESAAIAAYLDVLGYKTKSIRFGAHAMYSNYFYNTSINGLRSWTDQTRMKEYKDTVLSPTPILIFSFDEEMIREYPVETGG